MKNSLIKAKGLILVGYLFQLITLASTAAQTPPSTEVSPVEINGVELQRASLPGSSLQWVKVVTNFTTKEKWIDGVVFSARAILQEGEQFRVVSGMVRYMNIPEGSHSAILYLSPRAVQRFGSPVAVEVTALHNDAEASDFLWINPAVFSREGLPSWETMNVYQNVLVPINRTPWILIDYERSPDLGGN